MQHHFRGFPINSVIKQDRLNLNSQNEGASTHWLDDLGLTPPDRMIVETGAGGVLGLIDVAQVDQAARLHE